MEPDERERMHILCERIAKEENLNGYVKLVRDLNTLLDEKKLRLAHSGNPVGEHVSS
jgi:hypothetical protein